MNHAASGDGRSRGKKSFRRERMIQGSKLCAGPTRHRPTGNRERPINLAEVFTNQARGVKTFVLFFRASAAALGESPPITNRT